MLGSFGCRQDHHLHLGHVDRSQVRQIHGRPPFDPLSIRFRLAVLAQSFYVLTMPSDVTQLLSAIDSGDPKASEELLPLVYEELRRLAAHKMANERAGHTLQATALVHEAYLRLVRESKQQWH